MYVCIYIYICIGIGIGIPIAVYVGLFCDSYKSNSCFLNDSFCSEIKSF